MNPIEVSEERERLAREELRPKLSEQGAESPSPGGMGPSWLRLAYVFEFLIGLLAIITLWSEVGGESHLDLIPWYIKLACILGLDWCLVRFTAGVVEQPKVWSPRTLRWFACILLLTAAMGGITYYYHLHEPRDDDQNDEDTTAAAVFNNNVEKNNLGSIF